MRFYKWSARTGIAPRFAAALHGGRGDRSPSGDQIMRETRLGSRSRSSSVLSPGAPDFQFAALCSEKCPGEEATALRALNGAWCGSKFRETSNETRRRPMCQGPRLNVPNPFLCILLLRPALLYQLFVFQLLLLIQITCLVVTLKLVSL